MNEDSNAEPSFPPELEVRLIALALGESSHFERAELERMMAENPELKIRYRRLQQAHGALSGASLAKAAPGGNFSLGESRLKAIYSRLGQVPLIQKPTERRGNLAWIGIITIAALLIALILQLLWHSKDSVRGGVAVSSNLHEKVFEERNVGSEPEILIDESGMPTTGPPVDLVSRADRIQEPAIRYSLGPVNAGSEWSIGNSEDKKIDAQRRSSSLSKASAKELLHEGDLHGPETSFGNLAGLAVGDSGVLEGKKTWDDVKNIEGLGSADARRRLLDSPDTGARMMNASEMRAYVASTRNELAASEQPYSTFSLNVSDVSFHIARISLLENGALPDLDRVRVEDFVNAFDYQDPLPSNEERVACAIEQSAHPFRQQRNLLRIGIRTAATGRDQTQPLQITLLLDNSGSMEREDRKEAVLMAMSALASHVNSHDRINLISFSREPQLRIEALPGDRMSELLDNVHSMPTEGGTNVEAGLKLAAEVALRGRPASVAVGNTYSSGHNRIVMITDGAANLGDADPGRLKRFASQLRMKGVALDVCGVGISGLDDMLLRSISHQSDGRYYALDKAADAEASFVAQLAGALRPAARNVKVQVQFNPSRVGNYRLMGYDEHRLKQEDFHDDAVDAAELAAAEAGVALYEVEVLPEGRGDVGQVSVRFQDMATGGIVERQWTMPYNATVSPFDEATPSLQLAGAAAIFAEQLQTSAPEMGSHLEALSPVLNQLSHHYRDQGRVQDLIQMVKKAQ